MSTLSLFLFFSFQLCLRHVKILWPGIEPGTHQRPEPCSDSAESLTAPQRNSCTQFSVQILSVLFLPQQTPIHLSKSSPMASFLSCTLCGSEARSFHWTLTVPSTCPHCHCLFSLGKLQVHGEEVWCRPLSCSCSWAG